MRLGFPLPVPVDPPRNDARTREHDQRVAILILPFHSFELGRIHKITSV